MIIIVQEFSKIIVMPMIRGSKSPIFHN